VTARTADRGPAVPASVTAVPALAATAARVPVDRVPVVRAVTRTVLAQAPPTVDRVPVVLVPLARVPVVRGRAR
jgi:hypothetical protein